MADSDSKKKYAGLVRNQKKAVDKINGKFEKAVSRFTRSFGKQLIKDFRYAYETGKIRSLEAGKIDPSKFFKHVDKLAEKEIREPAEELCTDLIPKAYDQGVVFGSVALGASAEERYRVWSTIKVRVESSKSEFKGFSDDIAREIKRAIGDGIVGEKTQRNISKDIREVLDKATEEYKINRIIRTEVQKAVNAGVDDRYEREGLRDTGHGRHPPAHPGCRCTEIPERRDGVMVKVWLSADDERTCSVCPVCQDLDGTVI